MINDIINGVAEALKVKFPDYPIYVEDVPQGFQEPCFCIKYVIGIDEPYLVGRRLKKYKFDIIYFPEQGYRQNTDMFFVEDDLYSTLEYIKVLDILFRGTRMSSESVDGVLHFFVNYDKFIGENEVFIPQMQTLIQEENNG